MEYIRFPAPYADAIMGRDLESAVHYEDDSAGGVARCAAADVRPTDAAIDEATYVAEAQAIRDYNVALPPPPGLPAPPNPNGFLLAALGALGLSRGNALLVAWPTFTVALGAGNWGVARLVIDAATTAGTVTAEERTTLLALLVQYGIPEA